MVHLKLGMNDSSAEKVELRFEHHTRRPSVPF